MKKILLLIILLFSLNILSQNNSNYKSQEIIVKFNEVKTNATRSINRFKLPKLLELEEKLEVYDYQLIKNKETCNTFLLKFKNNEFSLTDVQKMYEDTGYFDYVEPNYIAFGSGQKNIQPDDSFYFRQWGLYNDGTFPLSTAVSGADIEMEAAWDIETGDSDMIVAIIDTGMKLDHPEIYDRLWQNTDEVTDGTDTDGNGYIDDLVAGWDFINNDNNPVDDHGHGTNVGGIALASGNNSIGYAGVNWNSRIMICKSLNYENSGSYSAMANAIYYAVDNGAKVINMSIGGTSDSNVLSNAIDYCYSHGVVLVACMMNFNNDTPYYPAAFDKTIAVGSTNPDDTRSNPFFWSNTSGSNFGEHIDIVAPGNYIYGLNHESNYNYNTYWGGTSQATPLVAGVVSLLFAQNPNLTFEEIRTILRETAEDQVGEYSEDTPGFDIYYGYGRLNAYHALSHELLSIVVFEDNTLTIFPNPIENNKFNVSSLTNGNYNISLYNTLGQNIYGINKSINKSNLEIELPQNIKYGVYILKLRNITTNESKSIKLLVK